MEFFCIILNFLQVSMNLGILKQFLEFIYKNEILKRSNGDMAEFGPRLAAQQSRRPGSLASHKADWSHKAVARPALAEEGVRWRVVGGVSTRRGWRVHRATSRWRELTLVAGRLRGGGIGGGQQRSGGGARSWRSTAVVANPVARGGWKGSEALVQSMKNDVWGGLVVKGWWRARWSSSGHRRQGKETRGVWRRNLS
jgi:hypothetical protein